VLGDALFLRNFRLGAATFHCAALAATRGFLRRFPLAREPTARRATDDALSRRRRGFRRRCSRSSRARRSFFLAAYLTDSPACLLALLALYFHARKKPKRLSSRAASGLSLALQAAAVVPLCGGFRRLAASAPGA